MPCQRVIYFFRDNASKIHAPLHLIRYDQQKKHPVTILSEVLAQGSPTNNDEKHADNPGWHAEQRLHVANQARFTYKQSLRRDCQRHSEKGSHEQQHTCFAWKLQGSHPNKKQARLARDKQQQTAPSRVFRDTPSKAHTQTRETHLTRDDKQEKRPVVPRAVRKHETNAADSCGQESQDEHRAIAPSSGRLDSLAEQRGPASCCCIRQERELRHTKNS